MSDAEKIYNLKKEIKKKIERLERFLKDSDIMERDIQYANQIFMLNWVLDLLEKD